MFCVIKQRYSAHISNNRPSSFDTRGRYPYLTIIKVSNQFLIQCNYFSISQLENADPNAEMIVREMFSTILKQVASDNTKNLTVATRIDYYAISYEKYC